MVWRSNDRSEDEYKKYLETMPWLAVPYTELKKSAANANKHIPSLVVYARDGRGITKGGVKEISKVTLKKKDENKSDISPSAWKSTRRSPSADGVVWTRRALARNWRFQ